MQTYAHRGMHGDAPENTMAAFLRAEMAGLDGIETDLRTTADGRIVLFHDRVFADRAIAEYTHAELVRVTGIEIPTLEDVLEREWRVAWNFEIKTRVAGDMAAKLLRNRAPAGTLISSVDHETVKTVTRDTGLEGALLMASLTWNTVNLPEPWDTVQTLVWDWNVARPDSFRLAEFLGWRNMVYGPVTQDEHDAAEMLHPWAVITDHPERMRNMQTRSNGR